jgi:uncharacterized protein with NRDE domain
LVAVGGAAAGPLDWFPVEADPSMPDLDISGWVSVRSMCLLIAMFQVVPGAPLIVAANRDERLDRPAVAMTVLRERDPRILGGRDELAGGTWLAVNEHGVVAGLTNQPSPDGRDPAKRSRGELPLAFARYRTVAEAVPAVRAELEPTAYNPCWMLVGDRESLYFIGISGGSATDVEQLEPGLHVLENAPLHPVSAKAAFVRELVTDALAGLPGGGAGDSAATVSALKIVLGDHRPAVPKPRMDPTGRVWPASLSAACVHADGYGTRSAIIVSVPGAAGVPTVMVADGRPCEQPMSDATALWAAETARP